MATSRLAIFYKDFTKISGYYSHIALGVGAMHAARVLRKHGIRTTLYSVKTPEQIAEDLRRDGPYKFAIIEAPWIPTEILQSLVDEFPRTEFLLRCHSQPAFLQADTNGMRLVREALYLQETTTNFRVSGNSDRFCEWIRRAYGSECLELPNLYDLHRETRRHRVVPHVGPIKIGSFGATRMLKLHPTAASAALIVARNRGVDLSFFLNVGRDDQGGQIIRVIREMFKNIPWAKLVEIPWMPWPQFRHQIAAMDACIQVSATETFNIVTADAIAEGIPSAVGPSIGWVPRHWQTQIDDPSAIARTVELLLDDRYAPEEGCKALTEYNESGVIEWKKTLATALED